MKCYAKSMQTFMQYNAHAICLCNITCVHYTCNSIFCVAIFLLRPQSDISKRTDPSEKPVQPPVQSNALQSMLQCFNPSIRYHHCWRPHHQLCTAIISRYTQLLNEISQHPNLNKQCNIFPLKCTLFSSMILVLKY